MNKNIFLAVVFAVSLAGASLSARATDQKLGVSYAASTKQNQGGSSIEVTRTFKNGVSIGAFLDRLKDREASGLHLQSPKTEVANIFDALPVLGRIGFGVAKSSSEWAVSTEMQQMSPLGVPLGGESITTSGVEKKWTPFLSGELSHDFQNGFEAFVGAKHYFEFAEHSNHSGKGQTFVNSGFRITF